MSLHLLVLHAQSTDKCCICLRICTCNRAAAVTSLSHVYICTGRLTSQSCQPCLPKGAHVSSVSSVALTHTSWQQVQQRKHRYDATVLFFPCLSLPFAINFWCMSTSLAMPELQGHDTGPWLRCGVPTGSCMIKFCCCATMQSVCAVVGGPHHSDLGSLQQVHRAQHTGS